MFNGLSKLADKSFVLGFFLPAFICTVAIIALIRDLPPLDALLRDWTQQKSFANLTVALLAVWTSSVLLMAGSHWMYRVLEGYAWPLNSRFLRERQVERRKSQREKMRQAYQAIARASSSDTGMPADADAARERAHLEEEVRLAYMRLRRESLLEYPEQRELVLPTRFGNVLRAFEMYAGNVYGVESIHAWPRLLAVVPRDYQTALADARAPVDFFVSLVFLSLLVGAVALARSIGGLVDGAGIGVGAMFGSIAVLAFAISRAAYLAATSSAIAWGEVVKSAFDLYLPELAKALGYKLPGSIDEQRRFWESVANQFQFQQAIRPESWKRVSSCGETRKKNSDSEGDDADQAEGDDTAEGDSHEPEP